jgi:hypothetical protein
MEGSGIGSVQNKYGSDPEAQKHTDPMDPNLAREHRLKLKHKKNICFPHSFLRFFITLLSGCVRLALERGHYSFGTLFR